MKDFLGNDLSTGDRVVLTAPNYRSLVKATVIGFTPKNVRVESNNTWNYSKDGKVQQYLSAPDFLVKIKEESL